jgi:predicted DNA-binding transcriptional regulator YafY
MRRADRLFQIIQALRRSRRPVRASMLAEELEVSKRSVCRDIADLIGQRVPIRGEAGLGYALTATSTCRRWSPPLSALDPLPANALI